MATTYPYTGLGFPYRSSATVDSIHFGVEIPAAATAVAVPPTGGFPISIAGRNYMVDTSFEPYRREAFKHKSIPPQRQSLHFTNNPDDGTVSTEGLWRREARDWSLGAGQNYFDRKKSDDARFYRSKGINPWTEWEVSLLQDVKQQRIVNGTVKAIRVSNYVYMQEGNFITFTSTWPAFQLGTDVNNAVTTFSPVVRNMAVTAGTYLKFGDEVVKVTSDYPVGTGGLSVTRGQLTTGAAAHLKGDTAAIVVSGVSGTVLDLTSDGYHVWILTTAGLYETVLGNLDGCATLFTWTLQSLAGGSVSGILSWAGGRLIMAVNNVRAISGSDGKPAIPSGSSVFDLSSATALAKVDGYLTDILSPTGRTVNIDYLQNAITNNDVLQIEGETVTANGGASAGASSFTVNARTGTAHAVGTPVYQAAASVTTATRTTMGWFYTHPSPQWVWSAIAGGSSQIYLAGHADSDTIPDPGTVYRTTIPSSGTGGTPGVANGLLTTPVVALPLPSGEYPTSMRGYLNYVFVGTNKGIRMCETLNGLDPVGASGDLKAGPLIPNVTQPVTTPVTAIVGNDRYIYFAWNNYDSTSSGLGRLDLTSFIDVQAPAYASDLMITDQGTVSWLSWDAITDSPLISFQPSVGTTQYVYTADTANTVPVGTIDSGIITYGIPDYKNAMSVDVNVENVAGSTNSMVGFNLGIDDTTTISAGTYSGSARKTKLAFDQQFGEQFRLTTNLYSATVSGNKVTPTLNRWTLKALPGIPSGITIMAVLLMYEPLEMDGTIQYFDPYDEYAYLESLRQSQQVVSYVEGPLQLAVTVDLIEWLPERRRPTMQGGFHGDLIVTLKTVTG